MNFAEYKYRKGGSNESPFFIHKNSLKFSLVKSDKCQCAFLERFGHVEIKQILLVGEIAS
jgi:hypothetical protein